MGGTYKSFKAQMTAKVLSHFRLGLVHLVHQLRVVYTNNGADGRGFDTVDYILDR
jgi:hypothetical protein